MRLSPCSLTFDSLKQGDPSNHLSAFSSVHLGYVFLVLTLKRSFQFRQSFGYNFGKVQLLAPVSSLKAKINLYQVSSVIKMCLECRKDMLITIFQTLIPFLSFLPMFSCFIPEGPIYAHAVTFSEGLSVV